MNFMKTRYQKQKTPFLCTTAMLGLLLLAGLCGGGVLSAEEKKKEVEVPDEP